MSPACPVMLCRHGPLSMPQLQLVLGYRGALDVVLHLEAVTLVDTHFARPATWRYEAGGGQQQDLENGAHHRQVVVSSGAHARQNPIADRTCVLCWNTFTGRDGFASRCTLRTGQGAQLKAAR